MRFKILTSLLLIAFIAAWLATFRIEKELGNELRRGLWSVALPLPIIAAVYFRGRRQAFFLAVSLVLAVRALELPGRWFPVRAPYEEFSLQMAQKTWSYFDVEGDNNLFYGILSTFEALSTITLCIISGLLAIAVYDKSQRE